MDDVSYLLYDPRYRTDPDKAVCLAGAENLEEAKIDQKELSEYYGDVVIVKIVSKGKHIVESKIVN